MKKICVYCGSSPGLLEIYLQSAKALGTLMAEQGIGLVYGGGNVGMMGVLANAVVENGGHVTGVITRHLFELEVAFKDLNDLRVVETMHERKALMAELADGFIALPGGLGTMDEIFEVLTWSQLNLHKKPCGFLNVESYFDQLIGFIDHMISQEFVNKTCRSLIIADADPAMLIERFRDFKPLFSDKAEWAKMVEKKRAAAIRSVN